jgi:hypothetical protein
MKTLHAQWKRLKNQYTWRDLDLSADIVAAHWAQTNALLTSVYRRHPVDRRCRIEISLTLVYRIADAGTGPHDNGLGLLGDGVTIRF